MVSRRQSVRRRADESRITCFWKRPEPADHGIQRKRGGAKRRVEHPIFRANPHAHVWRQRRHALVPLQGQGRRVHGGELTPAGRWAAARDRPPKTRQQGRRVEVARASRARLHRLPSACGVHAARRLRARAGAVWRERTAGDPPGELALGQAVGARHRLGQGLGWRVCLRCKRSGGRKGRSRNGAVAQLGDSPRQFIGTPGRPWPGGVWFCGIPKAAFEY